ncbi:hypothetical protein R3X26_12195 [Vibrio sp. TH_r3]|uniref:hypothetical protein n=1 Tax=Vibrio sp. TH_r3 TaxID=3082084 RepID=UPI0029551859|nr:hypothetical protein [Vibrio sp. TH_r3]MDV7105163.1 hypothetical protein [Vibrio sp. TH_r3]
MTSILTSIDVNRSGNRNGYRASKATINQISKSLTCELSEAGMKGKVTVQESVKSMIKVIDNLKPW